MKTIILFFFLTLQVSAQIHTGGSIKVKVGHPGGVALYKPYLDKTLLIKKIGDTIRFSSNFTTSKDLWIDLLPLSTTGIYNITQVSFHDDLTTNADHDLTSGKTIYKTNTTDIIGPYSLDDNWIGGAHLHTAYKYTGTEIYLPTGISSTPVILGSNDDGIYYSNDSLQVTWSNYLYKYSTIEDLGYRNGDTLIREDITLTFYPNQITIVNNITPLESTTMGTYYGLQWSNNGNTYDDSIHYLRGAAKDWETFSSSAAGTEATAPDYVGWLCMADDLSHRVLGVVNQDYGIGDGNAIASYATKNKGFTTTSKTYSYLIDNHAMSTTAHSWSGSWVFIPEIVSDADFYATYKMGGKDMFLCSFIGAANDTFNVGSNGKILKMIRKDSTLKLDHSFPLVVTASGYGVMEAEIVDSTLPVPYASYDCNYGITMSNGITAVNDQGPNNKDFAIAGSPKIRYAPTDSASIYFDGTDDRLYMSAANSQVFNSESTESFSVEFDAKFTEKAWSRMVAFYYGSGAFWNLGTQPAGTFYMGLSDGTDSKTIGSGVVIADGLWHHLVMTLNRDIDSVYMYIDNVKIAVASTLINTIDDVTNVNATFGWNQSADLSWSTKHLNFYTKALTATEINTLYNYYK